MASSKPPHAPEPPHAPDRVTWIEPVVRPIVEATDLGSVQVLKEANRFLLTDPFGDIHPDSRGLGLYDGDTRRRRAGTSVAVLRKPAVLDVMIRA